MAAPAALRCLRSLLARVLTVKAAEAQRQARRVSLVGAESQCVLSGPGAGVHGLALGAA